jgi:hypothetical protein
MQMTFLNNVRKVGILVLSRTSCLSFILLPQNASRLLNNESAVKCLFLTEHRHTNSDKIGSVYGQINGVKRNTAKQNRSEHTTIPFWRTWMGTGKIKLYGLIRPNLAVVDYIFIKPAFLCRLPVLQSCAAIVIFR